MTRFCVALLVLTFTTASLAATDVLDELNAARAQYGLPAFQRDDALTRAAIAAADFRAANGIGLHTSNDFAFVPAGAFASGSGTGWGGGVLNCCYATSNYPVAGAARSVDARGMTRMHIFVGTRFNGPLKQVAEAAKDVAKAVVHPVQTVQQVRQNQVYPQRRGLFRRWR